MPLSPELPTALAHLQQSPVWREVLDPSGSRKLLATRGARPTALQHAGDARVAERVQAGQREGLAVARRLERFVADVAMHGRGPAQAAAVACPALLVRQTTITQCCVIDGLELDGKYPS